MTWPLWKPRWRLDHRDSKPNTIPSRSNHFRFDPNTIGREEWRALGLTDKQIDGLERYQNKGGHFRTKKDLGRMYSIKPELFAAIGAVHPLAGQPHP